MEKKSKSNNQPLFIQFANCKFERKDLFNFLIKTIRECCPENYALEILSNIKELSDHKKIFQYFEPIDQFFLEVIKPDYESFIEDRWGEVLWWVPRGMKGQEEAIVSYFKKKANSDEGWNNIFETLPKNYKLIIYIAFLQFRLKDILNKVIKNKKLEDNLLGGINGNHAYQGEMHKVLFACRDDMACSVAEDTYLKRESFWACSMIIIDNFIKIFSGWIDYDLAEFLSTPRWKMLKQCPGVCGGKFFIKTGNMKHHSTECGKATKKKRDRESGRGKARVKKHRDKEKLERELRKKERSKEFRESAKGIA